jgi:glycosyltransferase involved in cell wall biosynthesis
VIPFPIFWTQIRVSIEVLLHRPDALFIMASALPIIHPKNSVVTIHDLGWAYYPETFGTAMRWYLKFSTWYACRFAKSIIAISEQTKSDLVARYALPEKKVHVVYHGFDPGELAGGEDPDTRKILAKLPDRFILYLGTLQPRKNPQGLIDAFNELKAAGKLSNHSLVFVGGRGWLDSSIVDQISNSADVVYLGYVKNRFSVLERADLLVQPAFYEGFGLQILDAFAAGVPVACSNVSSLPEVAGDAAEFFDPNDSGDMGRAICAVVDNSARAAELIASGSERLKFFTWQKCAAQTLAVILA